MHSLNYITRKHTVGVLDVMTSPGVGASGVGVTRARGESSAVRCARGRNCIVLRLRLAAAGANVKLLLDLVHCG